MSGMMRMHSVQIMLLLISGIVPMAQALLVVTPMTNARRKTATPILLLTGQSNEAWYYYEDDEDEDYYETSPPSFRSVGESEAEQELRNMPLASDEDEEDDYLSLVSQKNRRRPVEEDAWEDEDDEEVYEMEPNDQSFGEAASVGNFWTNPVEALDVTTPSPRRRRRRPPPSRPGGGSTKRKRTTFRSGAPAPPPPVSDFYNKLFWYGFDPNDAQDSPADRTMFGGTKGKFNGLAYLNSDEPNNGSWRRTRQARALPYMDDYDDYEEEGYDDDTMLPPTRRREGRGRKRRSPSQNPKPPWDLPRPRQGESKRRQRRTTRNEYYGDYEDEYSERINDVASWFDVQAEVDVENVDYDDNDRRSRRQARRDTIDSNDWNPLDVFLGKNRQALSQQANAYSRSMGLIDDSNDPQNDRRQRRRRNPQRPSPRRRPGFAYPYNVNEDDDTDTVVDLERVVAQDDRNGASVEAKKNGQKEKPKNGEANTGTLPPRRSAMTWEERSLAMERVPPANVPAWGPSGALGIDARTHAITEAMHDIAEAQRKVETRQAKVEKMREELSILKVDMELERQKLLKQQKQRRDRVTPSTTLRDLELDAEDAARALRYAQLQLQSTQEELADIERRHWGLTNFYDPDSASNAVKEAFRELAETEPAVQRAKEKMKQEFDASSGELEEEDTSQSGQTDGTSRSS